MNVLQLSLFFLVTILSSESINVTFDCESLVRSVRDSFPHRLRTSINVYQRVNDIEQNCKNSYLKKLNANRYLLQLLHNKLDRSIKESFKYFEENTKEQLICGKVSSFSKEDICSICRATISEDPNDLLEISPCQHKFCFKCIQNWVAHRSNMTLPSSKSVTRYPCPNCNGPIQFLLQPGDPTPLIKGFEEGKNYMKYFTSLLQHWLTENDINEYVNRDFSIMAIINEAEKIDSKWIQFNDVQYVLNRTENGSNFNTLNQEIEEWGNKVHNVQSVVGSVLTNFKTIMGRSQVLVARNNLDIRSLRYALATYLIYNIFGIIAMGLLWFLFFYHFCYHFYAPYDPFMAS
ncbi:hypothetical protein SNEBB_004252 [Seison nebaliae]|nr:hypothetical protein SNEBB_004252 [Seison nebaliae]